MSEAPPVFERLLWQALERMKVDENAAWELLDRWGHGASIESLSDFDAVWQHFKEQVETYRLRWARGSAGAVALVEVERRSGTGFIVSEGSLVGGDSSRPLLLTSLHLPAENGQIDHDTFIVARFGAEQKPSRVHPLYVLPEVDAIVGWLDPEPENDRPLAITSPSTDIDGVVLISHPRGDTTSFPLHENSYIGHNDTEISYRADPAPGSIGGPVFDLDGRVIGMHQSRDAKGNCRGISIQAIRTATMHAVRSAQAEATSERAPPGA